MEHSSASNSPSFNGNVIPNWWYQKITTGSGRPDVNAITVLAEIVFWYRPKSKDSSTKQKFTGDAWQTSYDHFKDKFNFSHEKTRRCLVKLEEIGIVTRELRTVKIRGQRYNNRLFIHLDQTFLQSPDEIGVKPHQEEIFQENVEKIPVSPNCSFSFPEFYQISTQIHDVSPQINDTSPHLCGDHIYRYKDYKKEYIKNRYRLRYAGEFKKNSPESGSESNFFKISSFLNLGVCDTDSHSQKTSSGFSSIGLSANQIIDKLSKKLNLKEFYPLSEEDCLELQKASGREFSLDAMNEILLALSGKASSRTFKNKKAFMAYMAKALKFEKRSISSAIHKNPKSVKQEEYQPEFPENLWGKIRRALSFKYGDGGKTLDRVWLSKLEENICDQQKIITLKAPNSFTQGWIQDRYLSDIELLAAEAGYKVALTFGNKEEEAV